MFRIIIVSCLLCLPTQYAIADDDRDLTLIATGFIAGIWEAEQYHIYANMREQGLTHEAAWAAVKHDKCNNVLSLNNKSLTKLTIKVALLLEEDKRSDAYKYVSTIARDLCTKDVN